MLFPLSERAFHFQSASAYDCWGNRRPLRTSRRHGLWAVDAVGFDLADPEPAPDRADAEACRRRAFRAFTESRRFTARELATIDALAFGNLTITELARREGCTRQAIMARIMGNSRGQGGLLRKARGFVCEAATVKPTVPASPSPHRAWRRPAGHSGDATSEGCTS